MVQQKTVKKSARSKPLVAATVADQSSYGQILSDMKQLIADSRRRALATVNRELVCLYWNIGRVIVQQQETAHWGDAVVEQLAKDLRLAFPDMTGLTKENLFRTRKFFRACQETDDWLLNSASKPVSERESLGDQTKVGAAPPQLIRSSGEGQLKAVSTAAEFTHGFVGAAPPQINHEEFRRAITALSWTHLTMIVGAVDRPAQRYFYMQMSVRERWSVRELRRQIDAALFERYVSVKRDPEKCLPADAEHGDLLPFKQKARHAER